MKKIITICLLIFTVTTLSAQNWIWDKAFKSNMIKNATLNGNLGYSNPLYDKMLFDSTDNSIYLLTTYNNILTFDNITLQALINTNGTSADILLIKYDVNGNLKWYKSFGSIGSDEGVSLIMLNNKIYVIVMAGKTIQIGTDTIHHSFPGYYHGFLIKFDKNGNYLYGIENMSAVGIAYYRVSTVNKNKQFLFSGANSSTNTTYFLNTTITTFTTNTGFIGVMDTLGNLIWQNNYTASAALSLQNFMEGFQRPNGTIAWIGNNTSTETFDIGSKTTSGNSDILIYVTDSLGSGQYFRNIISSGTDYFFTATKDIHNNIYIVGYCGNQLSVDSLTGISSFKTYISKGGLDLTLIKYNSTDRLQFVKMNGSVNNDYSGSVLYWKGKLYCWGAMSGTTKWGNWNVVTNNAPSIQGAISGNAFFMIADTLGNFQKAYGINNFVPYASAILGICADNNQNLYIFGGFSGDSIKVKNKIIANNMLYDYTSDQSVTVPAGGVVKKVAGYGTGNNSWTYLNKTASGVAINSSTNYTVTGTWTAQFPVNGFLAKFGYNEQKPVIKNNKALITGGKVFTGINY